MEFNYEFLYSIGLYIWFGAPFILIPALIVLPAPYGKFSNSKFGFLVNGKLAWFLQELISPLLWNLTFFAFTKQPNKLQWICWAMWNIHYFNRTVIYTYRAASMKPSPFAIMMSAVAFNIINGFINGYHVANYVTESNFPNIKVSSYSFTSVCYHPV